MKELISFFLIFLLFQSYKSEDKKFEFETTEFTNSGNLKMNYTAYENGTKLLTVFLNKQCEFLYVWVDVGETELRVRQSPLDDPSRDHEWCDIRFERFKPDTETPTTTCPYCQEIGINTTGLDKIYFNLTKEYEYNGVDFDWLKIEDVPNWVAIKYMHCNSTNYWEYDASRDRDFKYRPGYHHTPFIGWMNDPNGLVYENITGTPYYHLFYQFNPYSSKWDNMHWGHSKTTDFLTWIHLPPAIYRFQKGHIFSGSVAYYDEKLYAFFTVQKKYEHNTEIKDVQHNYIATSIPNPYNASDKTTYYNISDYDPHELGRVGKQFNNHINPILIPEEEKDFYDNNPGLTFDDYLDSPNFNSNYRDPKIVLYKDDKNVTEYYVLLMSADYEYRIYQNKNSTTNEKLTDFVTWALVGKFGVGYGVDTKYIQYECPDIVRIFPSGSSYAKWVFIANINPGCPFGGSATEYFTGDFDGSTYTSDHVYPKWMDFGKDHYATVTYNNIPREERVLGLPWTSNWIYAGIVPTTQYRSSNGLPREFTLFKTRGEYFLNVAPSKEVKNLRTDVTIPISETLAKRKKKSVLDISAVAGEGMYELNIDVIVTKNAKRYGFYIFNDDGEKIDFFFDTRNDKLWKEYGLLGKGSFIMDRRYSGNHNLSYYGEYGAHGREKKDENGNYAFIKNCYKYVDHFKLGTKIPMDLLKDKKQHNVQIFYDKSHVEVFLDGGRAAMTNVVFPLGDYYNKIKFYTDRGSVSFVGSAIKLEVPTSS